MVNVQLFHDQTEDLEQILELVNDWPYKPFRRYNLCNQILINQYYQSLVRTQINQPSTHVWTVSSHGTFAGFATLSLLPWDTEQLGMSAARIDYLITKGDYQEQYCLKKVLLNTIFKFCKDNNIQHISIRTDTEDLSSLHALESTGFVMVDGILTFALNLEETKINSEKSNINFRLATAEDSEKAANLARTAYIYDRFHADPSIPTDRANELHANWLRNSCSGKAADAVILAEENQNLLGFVTCKIHKQTKEYLHKTIGTIVLVATSMKARGRGIARATTLESLKWFKNHDVDIVDVGTQIANIPASRLYESCGFRLIASSLSLRKLI